MKQYMIINDNDPNEAFTVEAENLKEAYEKALEELGWWVSEEEEIYDEEDDDQNFLHKKD